MINTFRTVGAYSLKTLAKQSKGLNEKYEFLKTNAIVPLSKNGQDLNNAICLNFDLNKDCFEFLLSDFELTESNRYKFFAHSKKGSGFKIYLNTSSIIPLIKDTIPDSLKNIDKLRNNKKTSGWLSENVGNEYEKLIKKISDKFFIPDPGKKKKKIINPEKLTSYQKKQMEQMADKAKNKKDEIVYLDWYKYFLNNKFLNSNSKSTTKLPNVAMLLINGENILEYNDGKYKDSYINLVYFNFIKKHFVENSLKNKTCHICGVGKKVIEKGSPLPMNFYGTSDTNRQYFNGLKNNKTYQSFAICEDCTRQTFAGMKYVENNFRDYLFRNTCMLIPNADNQKSFNPKMYRIIFRILQTERESYSNEIGKLKHLIKKSNTRNLSFDLMFYYAEQNSFNILKLIHNIESRNLIPKLKSFATIAEKYNLDVIGKYNNLTLNTYLYYLFSKYQQNKAVYDNKKIIDFISTFFNNEAYNYKSLITDFIKTMKSHILNEKYDKLAGLKMNLFLAILQRFDMIKGLNKMEENNMVSEIFNEDYNQFFETHDHVYSDNQFRQGLFLLGTVIAQIKRAQKDKSSNFLKKMNFSGMSTRRLQSFINKVREYTLIYKKDIYLEKGIWGNIMDRLQGIEKSKMQPDEVVFYLLSGISFSDYLGMKKSHDKKMEKINNMEVTNE